MTLKTLHLLVVAWLLSPMEPAGAAPIDKTPPTLQQVRMPATAQADGPLAIRLEASDELSGVRRIEGTIVGPAGQTLTFDHTVPAPQLQFKDRVGLNLSKWLVPGRHELTALVLTDANGNRRFYGARELAKLGRHTTELSNAGVSDAQAPVLLKGEVLTPVLSLSDHALGTDRGPYAVVKLRLEDPPASDGRPGSGVYSAWLTFCQQDPAISCFGISGELSAPGQAQVRLHAAWTVTRGVDNVYSGTHYLTEMRLRDHAGNGVLLSSRRMGGATDFSALFPAGDAIVLVP